MFEKLNLTEIRKLGSDDRAFAKACDFVRSGCVYITDSKSTMLSGSVYDYGKNINVSISSDLSGNLSWYHCSCSASKIWRGACAHVLAVIIYDSKVKLFNPALDKKNDEFVPYQTKLLEDQLLEKENLKDLASAMNLLSTFKSNLIESIKREVKPVEEKYVLSPSLIENRDELAIYLNIGEIGKKNYVIKNVNELIQSMEKKETVTYGKSFRFEHDIKAFDPSSQALYALIKKARPSLQNAQVLGFSKDFYRITVISENFIDEFFEIYEGKELPIYSSESNKTLLFDTRGLEFQCIVKQEEGTTTLTTRPHFCKMYIGNQYCYVPSSKKLTRISKECAAVIHPIVANISGSKDKYYVFSGKHAEEFYAYLYPKLKEFQLLSEDSVVTNEPSLDYALKLYLDADKMGILARLEAEAPSPLLVRAKLMLESLGFSATLNQDNNLEYRLAEDDLIYEFYMNGIELVKNLGELYVTDEFDKRFIPREKPVKLGLRLTGNLFELSLENDEYRPVELLEILDSFRLKKRFHKLRSGKILSLDNEDLRELAGLIEGLDLSKKELSEPVIHLPSYRALFVDTMTQNNENVEKDKGFKRLTTDFKNYKDVEEVPEVLNPILREYQRVGYNWLKTMSNYGFGGILADDMGLGKTIQVIALVLSDHQPSKTQHVSLVVAPTSIVYNWKSEFGRFAPELKVTILNGTPAARKELFENERDTDVFITTYDTLKRDIENYADFEFRFIIADEAQFIKNPGTQNAASIKSLKSQVRFALTGTPMENSLMELWSIFDFVMPGYLFSSGKFSKLYETPIIKDKDKNVTQTLKKHITPFILRRVKKQVLTELPEKVETTLFADMTEPQRKLYLANLLKARGDLEELMKDGLSKNHLKILSYLTRLRQLCCHPALFVENYTLGSGKLDLALETISIAVESGSRILFFSQFTSMLHIIIEALDKEKYSYFYLDGGTDAKDRMQMMERFNAGDRDIFFISLKAGGTGLNLTGADVVIHYDPWWNPAVMAQATDRAHRYGQKKSVQVFNLVTKDSIEEKIIELHDRKKDLIDSVVTEGTTFINKLSEEEIKALFV